MQLNLAPLQCRFAAAVRATSLLIVLFLAVSSPRLVHAEDLTSLVVEDQNNLILGGNGPDVSFPLGSYNGLEIRDGPDEAERTGPLDLIRRAPPQGVPALGNNQFKESTIKIGETQWWYFPKSEVNGVKAASTTLALPSSAAAAPSTSSGSDLLSELRKRDGDLSKRSTTVFLSLTACSKPSLNHTGTGNPPDLPSLQVYVSTSGQVQKPGPGEDASKESSYEAQGGYMGTTVQADGDVYIGVTAPNATGYSGTYSYQVAASIDNYFHEVDLDVPFLYFVDADTQAALLTSDNFTQSDPHDENYKQWMEMKPPYTMFANNLNDTSISGLERSYCALDRLAQIGKGDKDIQVSMTSRGLGNKPKEQFYITGLNRTSTYVGILGRDGNSTDPGNGIVGGGGKIWQPMNFTTKTENNCAVVFDLDFCHDVAYAVPANPSINMTQLKSIYDTYASNAFKNFTYSLQQVQCNASAVSAYSLTVNCDNCTAAYKQWLCAVTIPRCADFSSDAPYLQSRNMAQKFLNGSSISSDGPAGALLQNAAANQSRNGIIDAKIQPGPYKELLPCQDICHTLLRNCPASLSFSCPTGQWLNYSYGFRSDDDLTCSYPGAVHFRNAASSSLLQGPVWGILYILGVFWGIFWASSCVNL